MSLKLFSFCLNLKNPSNHHLEQVFQTCGGLMCTPILKCHQLTLDSNGQYYVLLLSRPTFWDILDTFSDSWESLLPLAQLYLYRAILFVFFALYLFLLMLFWILELWWKFEIFAYLLLFGIWNQKNCRFFGSWNIYFGIF